MWFVWFDCYQPKLLFVMTSNSQDEYNLSKLTSYRAIMQNSAYVHITFLLYF